MKTTLGRLVILVDDYNAALDFYVKNFGCHVLHDSLGADGQRYLHIAFPGDDRFGIWLLAAEGGEQRKQVGRQTAGQPTLVLYTDDLDGLYARLRQNDVRVPQAPVSVPGSRFFHCLDLHGNRLTVVELPPAAAI